MEHLLTVAHLGQMRQALRQRRSALAISLRQAERAGREVVADLDRRNLEETTAAFDLIDALLDGSGSSAKISLVEDAQPTVTGAMDQLRADFLVDLGTQQRMARELEAAKRALAVVVFAAGGEVTVTPFHTYEFPRLVLRGVRTEDPPAFVYTSKLE